eukprot:6188134-Pleurochrysis_carterae.AAC.1
MHAPRGPAQGSCAQACARTARSCGRARPRACGRGRVLRVREPAGRAHMRVRVSARARACLSSGSTCADFYIARGTVLAKLPKELTLCARRSSDPSQCKSSTRSSQQASLPIFAVFNQFSNTK